MTLDGLSPGGGSFKKPDGVALLVVDMLNEFLTEGDGGDRA